MDDNGSKLSIFNGTVLLIHRSPEGIAKMFECFCLEKLIFLNYLFMVITAPKKLESILPKDRFNACMMLFPPSIQESLKKKSLAKYLTAPRISCLEQRASAATITEASAHSIFLQKLLVVVQAMPAQEGLMLKKHPFQQHVQMLFVTENLIHPEIQVD